MPPLYDYGPFNRIWRNEVAGVLCRPYRRRTWCPFSRSLSTILQCAWLLILWTKGTPPNLAENGRVPMLKALSPASIRPPFARYSHGIEVPAGKRLVVCSGQLGIRPDDTIPDDAEEQAELCFANIAAILAETGMGLGNVVRINAYVSDRAHMQGYMAARDRLFTGTPPASTLIIVSGFTRPEFKIEIEAIAAG
jgi:enamine deaminase RidA (YjgF/YER057c/UK114 family)